MPPCVKIRAENEETQNIRCPRHFFRSGILWFGFEDLRSISEIPGSISKQAHIVNQVRSSDNADQSGHLHKGD